MTPRVDRSLGLSVPGRCCHCAGVVKFWISVTRWASLSWSPLLCSILRFVCRSRNGAFSLVIWFGCDEIYGNRTIFVIILHIRNFSIELRGCIDKCMNLLSATYPDCRRPLDILRSANDGSWGNHFCQASDKSSGRSSCPDIPRTQSFCIRILAWMINGHRTCNGANTLASKLAKTIFVNCLISGGRAKWNVNESLLTFKETARVLTVGRLLLWISTLLTRGRQVQLIPNRLLHYYTIS